MKKQNKKSADALTVISVLELERLDRMVKLAAYFKLKKNALEKKMQAIALLFATEVANGEKGSESLAQFKHTKWLATRCWVGRNSLLNQIDMAQDARCLPDARYVKKHMLVQRGSPPTVDAIGAHRRKVWTVIQTEFQKFENLDWLLP